MKGYKIRGKPLGSFGERDFFDRFDVNLSFRHFTRSSAYDTNVLAQETDFKKTSEVAAFRLPLHLEIIC